LGSISEILYEPASRFTMQLNVRWEYEEGKIANGFGQQFDAI
jgi:hypothetical protein